MPGWANVDLIGENIRWNITRPLPVQARSIRPIYTEHFIEHATRDQALAILCNCKSAMRPGGAVRISTPDLRVVVVAYLQERVIEMPHGRWFPASPCTMVNEAMRCWGHRYLYDEQDLSGLLKQSGFKCVQRVAWCDSDNSELAGLETRPDYGDLILEARA